MKPYYVTLIFLAFMGTLILGYKMGYYEGQDEGYSQGYYAAPREVYQFDGIDIKREGDYIIVTAYSGNNTLGNLIKFPTNKPEYKSFLPFGYEENMRWLQDDFRLSDNWSLAH